MGLGTIAVLTSGGDAPGMNAGLRALTKLAAARGVNVLGVVLGYDGLIDGEHRPLTTNHDGELWPVPSVDRAAGAGGTVLGSARSKRFLTAEGRALVDRTQGPLEDAFRRLFDHLDEAELDQLSSLLKKARRAEGTPR